jgi:hypothetical protein
MTPEELSGDDVSPTIALERNRQASALNHLLGEIGLSRNEETAWWNLVAQPEL